ncbi:hypothetical protein [Paenibacillus sp. DMB20]|uniref:hypothetical protein n=1 Tax=Paenibacillus sp. DMB20 TaxID=1642570 RepID=UPI000B025407|nr:hypothetical protein [Paenibacillus sp. DMB20]
MFHGNTGAYPEGMTPNLRERNPADRAQSIHEIRNVPVPGTDPVYGNEGLLFYKWVK